MTLYPGSMTWQSHSFRPLHCSNQLGKPTISCTMVSLHFTAIPPVILKTNGVNVAYSTYNTLLAYWRFFLCFVLPEYIYGLDLNLYRSQHSGGKPSHQRKRTSAFPGIPQQLYQAAHPGRCWLPYLISSSPVMSCKTGST